MDTGDLAIIKANITGCHTIAVPNDETIECTWKRPKDIFTKCFSHKDGVFSVENLQHDFEGKLIHRALFPLRAFDWSQALALARQRS